MRIGKLVGAGTALAIAALVVPAALAINLTGVWEGEQKCDLYNGEKFDATYKHDVMLISQQGSFATVAALCNDVTCFLLYQGIVIDDAKDPAKKGQAGLTACNAGPDSPYHETLRASKLEIKKDGKADFDGTSIFFQLDGDLDGVVGTCSWKYKRVATFDPSVPACGEVGPPTDTAASSTTKVAPSGKRPF